MTNAELVERLRPRFADALDARGDVSITVEPERLLETLTSLRDEEGFGGQPGA